MPNNLEEKETPERAENRRSPERSSEAPRRGLIRRMFGLVFNRFTAMASVIVAILALIIGGYYWVDFSHRIDERLLSGEVFTTNAGIYSAPKTIRSGQSLSRDGLISYLKSSGAVRKTDKADASRSRFSSDSSTVTIEPGATAVIDGVRMFHNLDVRFSGDSIERIIDRDANREVDAAIIEPRLLSSLAGEGNGKRKAVSFSDLPKPLIRAIVVTEDRSFFDHWGVNFRGIARALWRRYSPDSANSPLANQGGSSITQQLVKNLLLSDEQTLERKVKEAFMAFIVETRLSKEEIFTLYANQIYLGQQAGTSVYGVGAAAEAYFGKDVTQLTLDESAFIAAIIRSPNRYNPFKYPEKATERRNQVLESMAETGDIPIEQVDKFKRLPLNVRRGAPSSDEGGIPYFTQYALEEVSDIIDDPETLQHLRIYTGIDPDLQQQAYEIVNRRLEALSKRFPKKAGKLNAALISLRPRTGEIVAMVGGRNFLDNQFNRVTSAERQPGSVFKPFVYAAAINSPYESYARAITAATVFKDEKKVFTFGDQTYSPNNYGDTFTNSDMTVRDALVKSKNVITVDLAMELNIEKVMSLAAKAGYPKVKKSFPSMALGTAEATPLQVATAYTVFANLGDRTDPVPYTRITNGEGKTIVQPTTSRKNVLRPDVSFIMNEIMKDVVNRGTAAGLASYGLQNIPGKSAIAGKTGTSRDGWFAGFTPELVTVVYVGFDDNTDLGLTGAESAMPIWAEFMKQALAIHPDWNGDWKMPDGIRRGEVDIRTGRLIREIREVATTPDDTELDNERTATASEPDTSGVPPEFRRIEYFIAGTMPFPGVPSPEQEREEPRPTPTPTPKQIPKQTPKPSPTVGKKKTQSAGR